MGHRRCFLGGGMGFLEPSSPMAASQVGNLVKKLIWVKRRVFLKVIYNISLSLSLSVFCLVLFCFSPGIKQRELVWSGS